ncbi:hypothetical protein ABIA32_005077 [Streptacidiphilus sp. MAP12-20]|uniref:hypothetical protein n=1 Tax=Streptacidiphilus sp. MAP12-20 TaxID=3156299 RepID=UPI00351995F6
MRLRSIIPAVTAAALLAAVVAMPGQAMADPSASPSASVSPAPNNSPSAPVTATPAPAPATPPVVDQVTGVNTDHGVVLKVTAHGGADISAVEVTAASYAAPTATLTSFTLTSGTASNGVWETTAPLGLKYAAYVVSADVVDSLGTHSPVVQGNLVYDKIPAYHDIAFGSTSLSFGNEQVTATGRVTTYDPATGDTGTPFVNSGAQVDLSGYMASGYAYLTAPDGKFKITASPGPNFSNQTYTLFGSDQYGLNHTTLGVTTVNSAAPAPTRIVLDSTSGGGYTVGSLVKLSGVAQYQDAQQVWHPLVGNTIEFGQSSYASTLAATDANGRFSLESSAPGAATTWKVYLAQDNRGDAFLAPASAAFQVTSVVQTVNLVLMPESLDEYSQLSFWYSVNSSDYRLPGNKVYVLESANGSSGWKNLGYIKVTPGSGLQSVTAWVANPHGYWKLWYPGAPGYAAAISPVIHMFRYLTAVTGAKPNTTWAYKGQTLHFSGGLWQQGYGSWSRMGVTRVHLFFRPYGSRNWQYQGYTWSNRYGNWNLYGRATTGGTWEVAWFTGDQWHVDGFGPGTYVHVR